ncbi:MAG: hypothetical protein QG655_22 [Actinomycetota bacterium]|jgi:hypothetical protein|nr:hypothetical protein [Actinomycetota bacterium]
MIGSVAAFAWLVSMPHAVGMAWVLAAVCWALYALFKRLHRVYSASRADRCGSAAGTRVTGPALTGVSNPVNITSGAFAAVGGSARWPAVWIGPAACPRSTGRPAVPAARGQRRRLSLRSVASMTHQRRRT